MMKRLILLSAFFAAILTLPMVALADTIDPTSFSGTLAVGESVTVRKTVTVTDAVTSGVLDVMFLIDTSGSMGGEIAAAKAAASSIITGLGVFGDVATGVGYYSEPGSVGVYHDLTTSTATGVADIGTIHLGLGGYGGDFPEEGLHAVKLAAEGASWRPGSTRFIIALGDANFKESDGTTLASSRAALAASEATFIGIDYGFSAYRMASSTLGGIDATILATDSGGSIISSTGLSTAAVVSDITSGVLLSFDEYSTVSASDMGAGLPGISTSVACVSADIGACSGSTAFGPFDRSIVRSFEFDVTFTGAAVGTSAFKTLALVDGGAVATEYDRFTVTSVDVPEPSAMLVLASGLLGLIGLSRKNNRSSLG